MDARAGVEPPAYGIIDPEYARVFTIARCLAWAEGYALAMQGSFTRDLDLLAVPWTDTACEPEHLARRIEEAAGLRIMHPSKEGEKPHGRLVWTLKFKTFGDPRFVDLSIMPRLTPAAAPVAVDGLARELGEAASTVRVAEATGNPRIMLNAINALLDCADRAVAALTPAAAHINPPARDAGITSPGDDPIVGHKTLGDGRRGYYHEPLRQSEAEALIAKSDADKARRAEAMPTERDAINAMWNAWYRLTELGWKEAIYCPKDGSTFDAIEAGSTGIHLCHYEGEWPTGGYWIHSNGDLSPSRPILFRPVAPRLPPVAVENADG